MQIVSDDALPLTKIQALEQMSGVSLGEMVARYDHSAENERVNLTAKSISKRYMERYGKKTK